jgi:hypothetical protein
MSKPRQVAGNGYRTVRQKAPDTLLYIYTEPSEIMPRSRLPEFVSPSTRELRALWRVYGAAGNRDTTLRLVAEIVRLRELVAELDVATVWSTWSVMEKTRPTLSCLRSAAAMAASMKLRLQPGKKVGTFDAATNLHEEPVDISRIEVGTSNRAQHDIPFVFAEGPRSFCSHFSAARICAHNLCLFDRAIALYVSAPTPDAGSRQSSRMTCGRGLIGNSSMLFIVTFPRYLLRTKSYIPDFWCVLTPASARSGVAP